MGSDRLSEAERLLAERGRDLRFVPIRAAAGRSGIAIGFPQDPLLHVSWPALFVVGLLAAIARRRFDH